MMTQQSGPTAPSAPPAVPMKQNIIFIHPDLGIGGAERLIVDAAVGLQDLGHNVTIFTSHCDPSHCFEEAKDGTLDVRVRGNTIFPSTFLGRFHILLATLRQIHLVLAISFFSNELRTLQPNIFIVDQLSACVPLLRWMWPQRQRILFYCHFPDQLLAIRNEEGMLGLVKIIYRWPFDWIEGWSMSGSDVIVVNSNFTRSVVRRLFPELEDLEVVYPCVNTQAKDAMKETPPGKTEEPLWGGMKTLLSINRFERKKDIELAIQAFNALKKDERRNCRLVIAGGYDRRVAENVEYHKELESLAESLGLTTCTARTIPTALGVSSSVEVLFLLSVSSAFKHTLLQNATLLVYTPTNEHFGIVPVEAMQMGVPVLAANTGGPLETVEEGRTGWLRDAAKSEQWTEIMRKVIQDLTPEQRRTMGESGKKKVEREFSRTVMAERLDGVLDDVFDAARPRFVEWRDILLSLGVCGATGAALLAFVTKPKLRLEPPPRPKQY